MHTWKFFRAGGVDQVNLRSGIDIAALEQLDQKLWVALSCPTRGLEFDTKTLDLIDADKDGRIRVPEMIAAIRWCALHLKTLDSLVKSGDTLSLDEINDTTPEGKQVLASANQILKNIGKPELKAVSVADTTDTAKIFAQTKFNGDGIVPADSAEDDFTKAVMTDIITILGAEADRGGSPGVNQAKVDQFFTEAQAYSDWWKKAESEAATVLPLGDATSGAVVAYRAVKAKIDDYFARCRLAAFDSRALVAMNRQESEYLAFAAKDLSVGAVEVAAFPLARIEGGKPLPLKTGVNPAWSAAITQFSAAVVKPIVGDRDQLTEEDWASISSKLGFYEAWSGSKAGAAIEKLGLPRIREILASPTREKITALVARDKALEPEAGAIASVDKLVRYKRDLYQLLNNYVSFADFYSRKRKAIFQVGTLYLDARSCDLCVRVDDPAKHGAMAHLSRAYLAYCDCNRKATGEKMTIAAAFTDGDSDNLMVGRNGVFYDRLGRDWDATIVKIVDNPISIRQAFWSPYKRVLRWIEDQVAKRAAAADAAATDKLTVGATTVAGAAETGKTPAAKPKIDIGVVAALGVAVGGITAALGALLQAFFGLGMLMPLGVVAIMLLISGPSMLIAYLKLRQRNLGPLLDANGWAVNAKAKINVPFGGALTSVAKLPSNAERSLEDPYAEDNSKRNAMFTLVAIIIVFLGVWRWGKLDEALPKDFKAKTIFGGQAWPWKETPETVKPAAAVSATNAVPASA
ncbi:MAG TPA: hypothetical protein VK968_04585, partial [Roseimicrobium sp.]|nr:hypothetical protein [Roseimicrobium sp.]